MVLKRSLRESILGSNLKHWEGDQPIDEEAMGAKSKGSEFSESLLSSTNLTGTERVGELHS